MLVLALTALLSTARQGREFIDPGIQERTILMVYKEFMSKKSSFFGGFTDSLGYTNKGTAEWTVDDGSFAGKACKVFRSDGVWHYELPVATGGVDHHVTSCAYICYVGLDGMPLRSESDFYDDCEFKKNVDIHVVTSFFADHYTSALTWNGATNVHEVTPASGMERFRVSMAPMIEDGLVKETDRKGAFISPYTGLATEYSLHVAGRFQGTFFFVPQEGYHVEVTGGAGTQRAYISRQGQLLKMDLQGKMDAMPQVGLLHPERASWGRFNGDWNAPIQETNPTRKRFKTLAVPVLIDNPYLLLLVPCVIAC